MAPSIATSGNRVSANNYDDLLWLLQWMQQINVLSLALLVTPLSLRMLGLHVELSIDNSPHDYLHSIRPFMPGWVIQHLFPDPIPLQRLDHMSGTTLYFPGVAVECVLGVVQGLWLGIVTLTQVQPACRLRYPAYPAAVMFLFVTMCLSAFPIHCLKDIDVWDIEQKTLFSGAAQFVDTFSTASAAVVLVMSLLMERQWISARTGASYTFLLLNLVGTITLLGVCFSDADIMALMHIGVLLLSLHISLALMVHRRYFTKEPCSHGFSYILQGNLILLASASPLLLALGNASRASRWTGGNYCAMTAFFVASRILVVQYWGYCVIGQSQCNCHHLKDDNNHAKSKKTD